MTYYNVPELTEVFDFEVKNIIDYNRDQDGILKQFKSPVAGGKRIKISFKKGDLVAAESEFFFNYGVLVAQTADSASLKQQEKQNNKLIKKKRKDPIRFYKIIIKKDENGKPYDWQDIERKMVHNMKEDKRLSAQSNTVRLKNEITILQNSLIEKNEQIKSMKSKFDTFEDRFNKLESELNEKGKKKK